MNSPLECGPYDQSLPIDCEPRHIREALFSLIQGIHAETTVVRPTWVKTEGITIKKGAYIITGSDGMHPIFGKVLDLLVLLNMVVIEVMLCPVEYFDSHYHAYSVIRSQNMSYVLFSNLTDKSVLHAHRKCGNLFIFLKHYFQVL